MVALGKLFTSALRKRAQLIKGLRHSVLRSRIVLMNSRSSSISVASLL